MVLKCTDPKMESTQTNETPGQHDTLLATPLAEIIPQQIVKFSEDGHVADSGPVNSAMTSYADLANDSLEHTVKDFLERPIIIKEFVWKQSEVDGTRNAVIALMRDWWNQRIVYEKLAGFRYIRCDFEIRLQINAQPSNAGGLIMSFIPFGLQTGFSPVDVLQYTGFRHVILDAAQSTSAVLQVPYIHPSAFIDLTLNAAQLGTVDIRVFSQLQGGGNDVECTAFVRAKNITLGIPTGLPGPPFPVSEAPGDQPSDTAPTTEFRGKAQAGKKIDPEAQVMSRSGPISEALAATAKVADSLGDVPVVGPTLQTFSWLSNIASGVAGAFGWSRPQDESTQQPVQQSYFRTMGNFNGDSKAKTIALDSRNEVRVPQEIYQTPHDEMSVAHLVQTPLAFARFQIKSNVVIGAPIAIYNCQVGRFNNPIDASSNSYSYIPTYSDYLARLFELWRGELIFTFKIFKTAMHSCRLRISYVPVSASNLPSYDRQKVYSEVYDIRERSDIEFRVPYAYSTAWLERDRYHGRVVIEVMNTLRNPSICADQIDVVVYKRCGRDFQFAKPFMDTEKHAAEWIRSSTGALERYQFKGDYSWNGSTGYTAPGAEAGIEEREQQQADEFRGTAQSGKGEPEKEKTLAEKGVLFVHITETGEVRTCDVPPMSPPSTPERKEQDLKANRGKAQSGAIEQKRNPETMRETNNMLVVRGMPGYDANEISFGEVVTSLRQLVKRYELLSQYPVDAGGKPFKYSPHVLANCTIDTSGKASIDGLSSIFGYLSIMYRFASGSMNVSFHRWDSYNAEDGKHIRRNPILIRMSPVALAATRPTAIVDTVPPPNAFPYFVNQPEETAFEVRVPHYIRRPVRLTDAYYRAPGYTELGALQTVSPSIEVYNMTYAYMARSAGEDFSLGYLLPPPSMRYDTVY